MRRTFKEPAFISRFNGQPAVALDVTKRSGANILETVGNTPVVKINKLAPEGVERPGTGRRRAQRTGPVQCCGEGLVRGHEPCLTARSARAG